ncbi:MAG: cyclic nucleotide-binding domain-containing protein, partial [Actinomycetota bacterium]
LLGLLVAGPLVRGALALLRALWRRARALWDGVRFRLERAWRVEAARMIDALPLFEDLPVDLLSDLAGRVRLRAAARGQPVVRQGDRPDAFYVVRRGTLQVVEEDPDAGTERILRTLGRGDSFGELGLLQGAPRAATVRAIEEVQLYEVGKGTFDELLADAARAPRFGPHAPGRRGAPGARPVRRPLRGPDRRAPPARHLGQRAAGPVDHPTG